MTRDECHEQVGHMLACRKPAIADWYPPGEAYTGIPVCREHAGEEVEGTVVLREDADG